jgi:hypothetical protein
MKDEAEICNSHYSVQTCVTSSSFQLLYMSFLRVLIPFVDVDQYVCLSRESINICAALDAVAT